MEKNVEKAQSMEDLEFRPLKKRRKEKESGNVKQKTPTKNLTSPNLTGNLLPVPGRFMTLSEVLEVVKNPKQILKEVPSGRKTNVFFIIDHSKHVFKKKHVQRKYHDDCGMWNPSKCATTNSHVILLDGTLIPILLRNNLYHRKEKRNWIPLDQQSDKESVIKVHRYYSSLKGDENYRRRVTILTGNGYKSTITLFEYCGMKTIQHNHKKNVHTDRKVIKKAPDEMNTSVRDVYNKMPKNKNSSPLNIQPLYDFKNVAAKKQQNEIQSKVTDEKRAILTMLAVDPSVQAVINRKDKPPCVILYSDDQFSDMKRNLECETVLGIDCCHKFGDCFVTMTVYQNSRALHKDTNEPLLYLGPVFIHWDQEFLTYVHFFSHIMDKLDYIEPNFEVKLGSGSSLSLFKALKYSFPTSEYMLNSDHLKETIARELHYVCNGRRVECSMLLNKMFGSNGLASSSSKYVFQKRVSNLTSYLSKYPKFRDYFGELQTLLYQFVCEPQQKGVFPKLWVNDNDGVLDEHIRSVLQQKPYELLELMEKLSSMSRLQMQNLEGT